jgi:hypothetical protein
VYPIEEDADAMRRRVGEDADEVSQGGSTNSTHAKCTPLFAHLDLVKHKMSLTIVAEIAVIDIPTRPVS